MARFLITLSAILAFAGSAWAGADTPEMPTIDGKGIIAETGVGTVADDGTVATVVFFESDDTGAYTGPTAAVIDTGDEACAVYGMTCLDVYIMDPAGGTGDELTDSACDTDQTDEVLALAFCY